MKNNGWVRFLVWVIVTLVCLVAIPTIAGYVIVNDKESRVRDGIIGDTCTVRYIDAQRSAEQAYRELRVIMYANAEAFAEMRADIRWIKKEMR
ncbi:hypothetical protein LCGC14_1185080 [marine sediment metagenome]|uniref:Uncharacterized protein n=1 Tax=marine sediment metagenome TaxID=412755 RepID=A0A0F9M8S3_9ZZZZ